MGLAKVGGTHTPQSYLLNCLHTAELPSVASIGAGVANTTVQTARCFAGRFKIAKVVVSLTAIDAVAGADSFNLVIGGLTGQTSQTYSQGNPAPLDNSFTYDPTQASGNSNLGYPTNIAVAGQTVFANDVPFNSANVYATNTAGVAGDLTGLAQPNTGWLALATSTGGYGIFVPTNYDAVYPEGLPLSLRVTTAASTGSISNLSVGLVLEYMGHYANQSTASTHYQFTPGWDF
jgi:hypothetical protein